ncbi:MAG: hypothetical protein AABX23_01425 [Nanoarchaeota archaeon]
MVSKRLDRIISLALIPLPILPIAGIYNATSNSCANPYSQIEVVNKYKETIYSLDSLWNQRASLQENDHKLVHLDSKIDKFNKNLEILVESNDVRRYDTWNNEHLTLDDHDLMCGLYVLLIGYSIISLSNLVDIEGDKKKDKK